MYSNIKGQPNLTGETARWLKKRVTYRETIVLQLVIADTDTAQRPPISTEDVRMVQPAENNSGATGGSTKGNAVKTAPARNSHIYNQKTVTALGSIPNNSIL
jgi:hypothetical protein